MVLKKHWITVPYGPQSYDWYWKPFKYSTISFDDDDLILLSHEFTVPNEDIN